VIRRALAYAWAAPCTALGLLLGAFAMMLGAHARRVRGVLEFTGGELAQIVAALPRPVAFAGLTLGHVILGTTREVLDELREHEHVHVRQYERWGALFIPAYALSSLWQLVRGRGFYSANHFEREARERSDA
jgi:hypothetical protein